MNISRNHHILFTLIILLLFLSLAPSICHAIEKKGISVVIFIVYDQQNPEQVQIRDEAVYAIGEIVRKNIELSKGKADISQIRVKEYYFDEEKARNYATKIIGVKPEDLPCVGVSKLYDENKTGRYIFKITPRQGQYFYYENICRRVKELVPWLKVYRIAAMINVSTIPPEADVKIDGNKLPTLTPLKNIEIYPGEHRITIEKTGYYKMEKLFAIKYGQLLEFEQISLTAKPNE